VANPPGGEADKTPPVLLGVEPESLAVGVALDAPLRFVFSEKVDRRGVARSVLLIPDVIVSSPSFDGLAVEIEPRYGWPPDSVVVWSLASTLKDKHGVALGSSRWGAFTTARALPPGSIEGEVRTAAADSELSTLEVNLLRPAPEGSRRRPPWRFGRIEGAGRFRVDLLDVPSGPFFLQAFLDRNGNGSRDEREPVAEVDSLYLTAGDSMLTLGVLDLVDLEGPVDTWACFSEADSDSVPRIVYFQPLRGENPHVQATALDSTGCVGPRSLTPGPYRVGAWLDTNGDGRFGPDSLGVSEPFLAPLEWEVRPERPDTLSLVGPIDSTLSWAVVDTLRPPPVPHELFPQ
jgi:hypothetical protein